eukprot:scaffold97054_cov33-Phaeocystis_antarctica.AAC.2
MSPHMYHMYQSTRHARVSVSEMATVTPTRNVPVSVVFGIDDGGAWRAEPQAISPVSAWSWTLSPGFSARIVLSSKSTPTGGLGG